MNTINLEEFRSICEYVIDNNKKLKESGKKTTALSITGESGIGKTSVIERIAEERGMTFIKLNLAQLDEVGDLTGFPLKQYKIYKIESSVDEVTGEVVITKCEPHWVAHDLLGAYLNAPCDTYELTDETRMAYAPPQWLPQESNPKGTILLLDDYNRAAPMFIQACMELIDRGSYVSWNLPENTTIILSQNPEDGDYNVNSQDNAQKTRYVNFDVEFELEAWARWAETYKLDDRCINFALAYPEIFESKEGVQRVNARSYVTFANAISGVPEWSDAKNLAMILNISKGCFTDKDNIVGHLFTTFIANKLDKLISPEDLLLKPWNTIKSKIESCVYDGNDYRPEVAAILHTRLLNFSMQYFDKKGGKTDVVMDRIIKLVDCIDDDQEKMLFSEDLLFDLIKNLINKYPSRTNKFLLNAKIRNKIK